MNTLVLCEILGGSLAVVIGKAIYDHSKGTDYIKYDTVTDLRLKRKLFNDKTYKTKDNSTRTTKGI